jgi:DNA-binding transcriptional regulator YbjK
MLVRDDTDDPELQREVALVGAWDLVGERYARMIAAVPKLLAACQAVVERWQCGDLAEAARMCSEAVQQATSAASSGNQEPADAFPTDRDQLLEQLVAKAEAAGLKAEDFDETVHELASGIAADINNAGLEDQLRYLIAEWGGEAAGREIDRPAEEPKTDATARRNK